MRVARRRDSVHQRVFRLQQASLPPPSLLQQCRNQKRFPLREVNHILPSLTGLATQRSVRNTKRKDAVYFSVPLLSLFCFSGRLVDRASVTLRETVLWRTWLRGVLGDARAHPRPDYVWPFPLAVGCSVVGFHCCMASASEGSLRWNSKSGSRSACS